jgi:hypothetical protein
MGSVRVPAPAGRSVPSLLSASTKSRGDRQRRLSAWGRGAVKRLRHLGLDIDTCDVDEGGILFVPDGRLTLTLDADAVEVAMVLPPHDLPALRSTLGVPLRSQALASALAALPEQFSIGASSEARRIPAPHATGAELRALLDRAEHEGSAVWLGWTVLRDVAAAHMATLDAQLQDALVALGQVLKLFARASDADPARPRRARRHAGGRGHEEGEHGKPRARTRARERDREPDPEREVEPESAADPEAPAPRVLRPLEAKPRLRAGLLRRGVPRPGESIEKGAKVRVLEGPFAGKEGLVQDLDGNGGARVMLGLLAVRIDVNDLVSSAQGRGRPRLSSSHRRPMPVRS